MGVADSACMCVFLRVPLHSEGNLIIRDRSKDLIKSGGEWISSVDLENHIASLSVRV